MDELICVKCNLPLVNSKAKFFYLDKEMHSEVLKCPKCGQVFLNEGLVNDKIKHIEEAMEDK